MWTETRDVLSHLDCFNLLLLVILWQDFKESPPAFLFHPHGVHTCSHQRMSNFAQPRVAMPWLKPTDVRVSFSTTWAFAGSIFLETLVGNLVDHVFHHPFDIPTIENRECVEQTML